MTAPLSSQRWPSSTPTSFRARRARPRCSLRTRSAVATRSASAPASPSRRPRRSRPRAPMATMPPPRKPSWEQNYALRMRFERDAYAAYPGLRRSSTGHRKYARVVYRLQVPVHHYESRTIEMHFRRPTAEPALTRVYADGQPSRLTATRPIQRIRNSARHCAFGTPPTRRSCAGCPPTDCSR